MPGIAQLKGLGPASAKMLESIGIDTVEKLRTTGAVEAYVQLKQKQSVSLNLLYAMVGALEDMDWQVVARERAGELIMELEQREMMQAFVSGRKAIEADAAKS